MSDPRLNKLAPDSNRYRHVEQDFNTGWLNGDKSYNIVNIYLIDLSSSPAGQDRYQTHREYSKQVQKQIGRDVPKRWLFHGTQRTCRIGNNDSNLRPCHRTECYVCSILRTGFNLAHADTNGTCMFGKGIYTSEASSKADGYANNHHLRSPQHAMILATVVVGNQQYAYKACPGRTQPDSGYNSIEGVTKSNGGSVNYPETVVYCEEALEPVYLIMYTRA